MVGIAACPYTIRTNRLLESVEPELALDDARAFGALSSIAGLIDDGSSEGIENAASLSDDLLEQVHRMYGPAGLFRLVGLAMSHPSREFGVYLSVHEAIAGLLGGAPAAPWPPCPTDDRLHADPAIERLNHHVLQPSLARKLFNTGELFGSVVYGFGGPRILVSHPFRGADGEVYGAYENSVEIARALVARGFHGRMLFLDNLLALNDEMAGVPTWLAWFSMIAVHSDLVVFVTTDDRTLSPSQAAEVAYTPERVHKTVVPIGRDELSDMDAPTHDEVWFFDGGQRVSADEFRAAELEAVAGAMPLLEFYVSGSAPHDALYVLSEGGDIRTYPAGYEVYG